MTQEVERVLTRMVTECGMVRRGKHVKPGLRGDVRFSAGRTAIVMEIRDHAGERWAVEREIPPDVMERRLDAEAGVIAALIEEGHDSEPADLR